MLEGIDMNATRIFRATDLPEAAKLLRKYGKAARLMAGGTDLMLAPGAPNAEVLVDLSTVGGSAGEIRSRDGMISVGALVTFQQIAESDLIRSSLAALWDAARAMGSLQIRSRGTIGGNIMNASPAGDSIPPLMAGAARANILSMDGTRSLPVSKLFTGPGRTVLRNDEVLESIVFPVVNGTSSAFLRIGSRSHHIISKVSMAMAGRLVDGRLRQVRVAMGAVAPTPILAPMVQAVLENTSPTDTGALDAAARAAAASADPIDDIRSTRQYRLDMCRELTRMVLQELLQRLP